MRKIYSLGIVLLSTLFSFSQVITTTANSNGNTLAQLLAGNGVTVTNVTYNCGGTAGGTFTGTGSGLGLNGGVILTTGSVNNAPGPNNSPSAGTDNLAGGDVDLDIIASAAVQDVCKLEFDIVPLGNTLQFDYVFGSEEYLEWVNAGYNDAFGFFVTGPIPGGGNYSASNIALVPGTSTPVTIDNVNTGSYAQYYVDNTGGANIQYDGYTTVLNAIINVIPCQTYHFKLAVGDVGDGIYDSGVFLETNSLTSNSATAASAVATAGYASTYEGCVNGTITFNMSQPAGASQVLTYTVTGTATNGVDYNSLPGTITVPQGQSSVSITLTPNEDGLVEGQETVTINLINPCDGTIYSSTTININDIPNVTVGALDTTLCPGQTTQLLANGGASYTWSPSAGLSSTTIPNPTYTAGSGGLYTVSATWGSCVNTANINFTITPPPVVYAFDDTSVCNGQTAVITSTPGLATIAWNNGLTTPSINVTAQGDYFYTGTDANGCVVSSDTATVSFFAPPLVNLTASEDTICPVLDSTVLSAGNNLAYTYTWTPGGVIPGNYTVYTPGTYTVDVFDGNCHIQQSITIPPYFHAPITLGPDQTVCQGQTVTVTPSGGPYVLTVWHDSTLTSSYISATPGTVYAAVYDGNCFYPTDTMLIGNFAPYVPSIPPDTTVCFGFPVTLNAEMDLSNYTWSNGQTGDVITVTTAGDYSYSAQDGNGCTVFSDTMTLTVQPLPVINMSATPPGICNGQSSVLDAGSVQGLSYLWSTTDTTSTITVSIAGTYTVTASDGLCSNTGSITVNAYTHPPITLGNDTTVCPGESVLLVPSGAPYVTYLWTGGSVSSSLTVTQPGSFAVTVTDANCTYVSDTITISNFTVVIPDATGGDDICTGESIVLSGTAGYNGYTWTPGSQTGQTITVSTAGTYNFTATDANGCSVTSTSTTVTVNPLPNLVMTATPNPICTGETATLSAGNEAGVSYLWSTGANTPTITVSAAGVYTVIGTTAFQCADTASITVTAGTTPVIALTDTFGCNSSVTLNPGNAAGYTYQWSDNSTGSTLDAANSGTYSVTVSSADGCTATATADVIIYNVNAFATATPDTIDAGATSQLEVTTGYIGTFTYLWSPAASLNDAALQNPVATPSVTTDYTVLVTDADHGCLDTANVTVFVRFNDLYAVPNVFSPNNDGHNDVFIPYMTGSSQVIEDFRIYNRWGQIVHEGTVGWDGIYKDKAQPQDTYTYFVSIRIPDLNLTEGYRVEKKMGEVTLMR